MSKKTLAVIGLLIVGFIWVWRGWQVALLSLLFLPTVLFLIHIIFKPRGHYG